ncbi:signal recognition particle [Bosea sp. TND4EK4]|uniref:signal recognition particle n=1 Tax=Bosea sp. TND4EK4 TaxID=1907408 RepID=UPI001FCD644C|nr:signal recognition particle [Bosea sp. TND4EK4]
MPLLLCTYATAGAAQDLKSMTLANELGSVLASEELCDLSYNQSAIAAFIEKRVKADDLGFATNLRMMTAGQEFQLKGISASSKTAHCAQIRRVAKAYGFVS